MKFSNVKVQTIFSPKNSLYNKKTKITRRNENKPECTKKRTVITTPEVFFNAIFAPYHLLSMMPKKLFIQYRFQSDSNDLIFLKTSERIT